MLKRQRLIVTGVVQGVGFRPFVYGLALELGLTGFVGNDSGGVFIEIEGLPAALAAFQERLVGSPPPLAHIEDVTAVSIPPANAADFVIVLSKANAAQNTLISPDISICDDCLRELLDPADRRYRYPFVNCTNCGPRFTIIKDIPYDRPLTTMADFSLCADCLAEYENPLDRRFHAQPNACSVCGPKIWLKSPNLQSLPSDPILAAQRLLVDGKILAVKGLGGFHLACDAANEGALHELRRRKGRVDKPFAVMALDVTAVRQFAHLSPEEEALLTSKERPILLLRKKAGDLLSALVAPGNPRIGVMLPYTPLHYLLLQPSDTSRRASVFVMTSGNYSNEPIIKDNDEARERLAVLADAFLLHNRDIYGRCDDSVIRIIFHAARGQGRDGAWAESLVLGKVMPRRPAPTRHSSLLPFRRSRGYAPFPVKLPFAIPPTLAVGGELKATFCLAEGDRAFMSQHIGDMENLETLEAFETAVTHYRHIFRINPKRIVCDLHPDYLSTQWALRQRGDGVIVTQVQHHHAHITAAMAEHRLDGAQQVIGFSFDGTGYGSDGAIWGGEVLLADYTGFERPFHLKYVPLAGGDAAIKRPYRLALAHLWAAGLDWDERLPCVAACLPVEQNILRKQLQSGLNAVPTSSMGRLFDAVASLAGVRQIVTYEGQAAIELEGATRGILAGDYRFGLGDGVFDAAPVVRAVVEDVLAGMQTAVIAAKFHNAVAALILTISVQLREQTGLNQVVLSGGVFQNVRLLETAVALLQEANFDVYTHRLVPPNDGGVALGQAVIGAT